MAETDSIKMTKENEKIERQIRSKLWLIKGVADILFYAANGNDELPGGSVEEVAKQIYNLAGELEDDLESLFKVTDTITKEQGLSAVQ